MRRELIEHQAGRSQLLVPRLRVTAIALWSRTWAAAPLQLETGQHRPVDRSTRRGWKAGMPGRLPGALGAAPERVSEAMTMLRFFRSQ